MFNVNFYNDESYVDISGWLSVLANISVNQISAKCYIGVSLMHNYVCTYVSHPINKINVCACHLQTTYMTTTYLQAPRMKY